MQSMLAARMPAATVSVCCQSASRPSIFACGHLALIDDVGWKFMFNAFNHLSDTVDSWYTFSVWTLDSDGL
jgi:hypothetical protein